MTALQALQALQMQSAAKYNPLIKLRNKSVAVCYAYFANHFRCKAKKRSMKTGLCTLQALHPLTGVNWALQSRPSLPLGASLFEKGIQK